jgi:nucleoside-diphosphate-sugar epimerase
VKKILITGASGFIGSFLVEEALKNGYDVYAGIRKSSSKKYLKDPRVKFFITNFADKNKLSRDLKQQGENIGFFNYVIHNAGATKAKNRDDFININYTYTQNLVDALINSGHKIEKFIFMSSLAVFGPGNPISMEPIKDTDTPNPITYYGESKLMAENYLSSLKNFPWVAIRPTGVYGPREKDYLILIKTMKKGLEPYIGTTKQQISFIYVKDLCRVIFDVIKSNIEHKAYFVADGFDYYTDNYGTFVKEILNIKTLKIVFPLFIAKIIAIFLEKFSFLTGNLPTINREKIREISSLNWKVDISSLKKDFNFKAKYNLKAGVEDSIAWYKENDWI